MRLSCFSLEGRSVLAVRHQAAFLAVDQLGAGLPGDLGALLALSEGVERLRAALATAPAGAAIDLGRATPAPPIAAGAKVLCLGLNYVDHASEASFARPEHPVIFARWPSSFVGHGEPLQRPPASARFDYEAELVAVIGRGGKRIAREEALAHVAGYTLMNDGSVRDWQTHSTQWVLGKNFDRSGSIGPEVVTADELPPGATGLRLRGLLDGKVMQEASTSDMIFDVATTIAYVSQAIALAPGDLIAMGTPAGVGHARKPPVYLAPGNTFTVEVERIGKLENPIADEVPQATSSSSEAR